MNGTARMPVSPYLDEPWRRLAWISPLAVLIWAAVLFGFSLLLSETAAPPPELKPLEARVIELPPVADLQGGPAPAAHPAPPQPHLETVRKPVPVVHPRPRVHHREKVRPITPPMPPSPTGTAKTEVPPTASTAPAAPSMKPEGGGVPGGTGTGGGSGLGSDTTGARAIYAPVPKIPDELREDTLAAVAVAHFRVGYDGNAEVVLVQPTSNPRLNEIVLDTLKQWRFFPAMKGGVAVNSEFDVRIPITVQ
jgi:periplasmic protein TonB